MLSGLNHAVAPCMLTPGLLCLLPHQLPAALCSVINLGQVLRSCCMLNSFSGLAHSATFYR